MSYRTVLVTLAGLFMATLVATAVALSSVPSLRLPAFALLVSEVAGCVALSVVWMKRTRQAERDPTTAGAGRILAPVVKPTSFREQLFFSTVRIEVSRPDGTAVGTGALIHHAWDNRQSVFIVTNKHVLDRGESARFFFLEDDGAGQPRLGNRLDVVLDNLRDKWVGHPGPNIDVAVIGLAYLSAQIEETGKRSYYKVISSKNFMQPADEERLDAIEEVFFIGYPNGIFDRVNYLPVARRAVTATPPIVDYGGHPTFLIDGSVFPGSSGSPVLLLRGPGYETKTGHLLGGSHMFFLGIVASVLVQPTTGELHFEDIPTGVRPVVRYQDKLDLGIVFKARTVRETIEAFLRSTGQL